MVVMDIFFSDPMHLFQPRDVQILISNNVATLKILHARYIQVYTGKKHISCFQ